MVKFGVGFIGLGLGVCGGAFLVSHEPAYLLFTSLNVWSLATLIKDTPHDTK